MQYLDLDNVTNNVEFALKLKGKEHKLVEASVQTFIDNTKDIESLGVNASQSEEMDVTIRIIKRSFPTISDEDLMGLTMTQLKAINDYARTASAENVEKVIEDTENPEGNGQAANS